MGDMADLAGDCAFDEWNEGLDEELGDGLERTVEPGDLMTEVDLSEFDAASSGASLTARIESQRPWWRMGSIDPGEFAMLRTDEAANVLWNLCSAHGDLAGIVAALEAKREAHAETVIASIMADVNRGL